MNLKELFDCGGVLLLLMTIVQITPMKVNPWSWVARLLQKGMKAMGRAFNADTMKQLEEIKENQTEIRTNQTEIQRKLEEHIETDDIRHADGLRVAILKFNLELIRGIKHTHEDFSEVLRQIDEYEQYCRAHEKYPNSKAVYAIGNIKRVYKDRLKKRDFAEYPQRKDG